jgi:hypothetical protein
MDRQKTEYRIGINNFQPASADGAIRYEPFRLARQPEPGLIDQSVALGDSREGWVVLSIPRSEEQPLLAFHRDFAHSNYVLMHASQPVWFKLYAPDPMQLDGTCAECRV